MQEKKPFLRIFGFYLTKWLTTRLKLVTVST